MFSGGVAGEVYASIKPPQSAVLIGPDHYGAAQTFSVFREGAWQMPLGTVSVDESLADRILKACPSASDDARGHSRDHCLEVQLPFLQKLNPAVRIVPILVSTLDPAELRAMGHALGGILMETKPTPLLVASSDMNHYEPLKVSEVKDRRAIRAVLELDEERLLLECQEHNITMCGLGPAYVTLVAAKRLGATRAELIDYRTSADAGGDEDAVVGYAGIVLW
jgi:AmmeMemoRadiSam system protein B